MYFLFALFEGLLFWHLFTSLNQFSFFSSFLFLSFIFSENCIHFHASLNGLEMIYTLTSFHFHVMKDERKQQSNFIVYKDKWKTGGDAAKKILFTFIYIFEHTV